MDFFWLIDSAIPISSSPRSINAKILLPKSLPKFSIISNSTANSIIFSLASRDNSKSIAGNFPHGKMRKSKSFFQKDWPENTHGCLWRRRHYTIFLVDHYYIFLIMEMGIRVNWEEISAPPSHVIKSCL